MQTHVPIQQPQELEGKAKLVVPSPYQMLCKNISGAKSAICAVFEIDRLDENFGYMFVKKPSRHCMDADRLVIARSHEVPNQALFHAAHMSAVPLPVKYDTTAVNGRPVVGETLGTVEGTWKLSSDYEGFRAVKVDADNELVWVVPAHMWGMEDPPFQNVLDAEWYLFDQPPPYKGVRFEIFVREIGSGGDGQWIPAHFDSFGHLLRLNDGAGTTEGTTPAETTDPFTTDTTTTDAPTSNPPSVWCPPCETADDMPSSVGVNLTGLIIDNDCVPCAYTFGSYSVAEDRTRIDCGYYRSGTSGACKWEISIYWSGGAWHCSVALSDNGANAGWVDWTGGNDPCDPTGVYGSKNESPTCRAGGTSTTPNTVTVV